MLLEKNGKPLIQYTYEAAGKSALAAQVGVVVDGEELGAVVRGFCPHTYITDPNLPNGTTRIVSALRQADVELPDIVVNVQGDEPCIGGDHIDTLIRCLLSNPSVEMATLAAPLGSNPDIFDQSLVKVVVKADSSAAWFSRMPIPYTRSGALEPSTYLGHIGVYAYRLEALLRYARLPSSAAQEAESLEQLKAIHHGMTIRVCLIEKLLLGVDRAQDWERFVRE